MIDDTKLLMSTRIAKYYGRGLWTRSMVMNTMKKGCITEDQCKEILGETEETPAASTVTE